MSGNSPPETPTLDYFMEDRSFLRLYSCEMHTKCGAIVDNSHESPHTIDGVVFPFSVVAKLVMDDREDASCYTYEAIYQGFIRDKR